MRGSRTGPGNSLGPRPTYSPGRTLAGALLLFAAFVVGLVVVSSPAATAMAGSATFVAVTAARLVRRRLRRRRATGRTRQVCVPRTDRCIEA
ncbi:hypothetical protein [Halorarius litoreus]|uniref:hypothetical protein n=1 Tax=Halorarius litoreus TaxID=2962676 RepID=UPI0020CE24D1|nr:hypothetical protein [Halorarius litoreus]